MADRGRGRRDTHDRENVGRGRGRGAQGERYREFPTDREDRFERDDHRKRPGVGVDDDWRERRDRREPPNFPRGERDYMHPSRLDRPPAPPKPPSREGSRDTISRPQKGILRGDQPITVAQSPRERGMIDKLPTASRPVVPQIHSATSANQPHGKDGESPRRRASTISDNNEPSPVGKGSAALTQPSPMHHQEDIVSQGPVAAAAISSWLQAMMQQQAETSGEQQFALAELIQNASYTHYRHMTSSEEYKNAQAETAKHSTHFPQFPALRERYTGAEKAKETAYLDAKASANDAAHKLNLFLVQITSAVVTKRNEDEHVKEALRVGKDALRLAEEGKRGIENVDSRLKKFVERESTKPPSVDAETLKRLEDEVKQLRASNSAMKLDFQHFKQKHENAMKSYEEMLEKFLQTQEGFKNDVGKLKEERELSKGEVEGVCVRAIEHSEGDVEMEKAIKDTSGKPAEVSPWLPPDFRSMWEGLIIENKQIQTKLDRCDEAVAKAQLTLAESHNFISDEINQLQSNLDQISLQTHETQTSIERLSTDTHSALEKLTTETSNIIGTHLPEFKSKIQSDFEVTWTSGFSELSSRIATVEKHTTSQGQLLETFGQRVQLLTEKLDVITEKVKLLENVREGIEVAIQGMGNQMQNFQLKEIAEKVASIIGIQRLQSFEREIGTLRNQVQALAAVTHQGQKSAMVGQFQAQLAKGPLSPQAQLKNGMDAGTTTNGMPTSTLTTSGVGPSSQSSASTAAQHNALQSFQQQLLSLQQQYQQLSASVHNTVTSNNQSITTIMARLGALDSQVSFLHSIVQPLTVSSGPLPLRLAKMEQGMTQRFDAQDTRINNALNSPILTTHPPLITRVGALDMATKNMEKNVSELREISVETSNTIAKLHEEMALVHSKLPPMSAMRSTSGLPEGFLEEYAPGSLNNIEADLGDLRRQFEQKVDNNLKKWAAKVKEHIFKANRRLTDLEGISGVTVAGGGEDYGERIGTRGGGGGGANTSIDGGLVSRGVSMEADSVEKQVSSDGGQADDRWKVVARGSSGGGESL